MLQRQESAEQLRAQQWHDLSEAASASSASADQDTKISVTENSDQKLINIKKAGFPPEWEWSGGGRTGYEPVCRTVTLDGGADSRHKEEYDRVLAKFIR